MNADNVKLKVKWKIIIVIEQKLFTRKLIEKNKLWYIQKAVGI